MKLSRMQFNVWVDSANGRVVRVGRPGRLAMGLCRRDFERAFGVDLEPETCYTCHGVAVFRKEA